MRICFRWCVLALVLTQWISAKPSKMEQQELDRHGLCVGSESFQQSFQPYLQSEYPLFITSDSLLNGFHVLLEESLRAAEIRNAILLNRLLSEWRENLPKKRGDFAGDSALIEAGYQRAAWVLEIAQHLSSGTGSLDSETAQELSRIEQAAGRSQSPTLGLDLDYRRFAPTGFYATNPDLSCYYRAVRWLQLVPFRWEHEQEWLAMEMIRRAANPSHESLSLWQDFWALIGEPDNPRLRWSDLLQHFCDLRATSFGEVFLDTLAGACQRPISGPASTQRQSSSATCEPGHGSCKRNSG